MYRDCFIWCLIICFIANDYNFFSFTENLTLFISFSVLNELKQEMASWKAEKESQAAPEKEEGASSGKGKMRWVCDYANSDLIFSLFGFLKS